MNPFFTQEIEIIGISSIKKIIYPCEVATHLENGLQYIRERMPDNVKRFFKKFEKDIRYATTYFNEFNKVTFVVILCINTERQQTIRYNNLITISTVLLVAIWRLMIYLQKSIYIDGPRHGMIMI
jgi:hypothetical protein